MLSNVWYLVRFELDSHWEDSPAHDFLASLGATQSALVVSVFTILPAQTSSTATQSHQTGCAQLWKSLLISLWSKQHKALGAQRGTQSHPPLGQVLEMSSWSPCGGLNENGHHRFIYLNA